MIRLNGEYFPIKAVSLKNGAYTSFGVPLYHREGEKEVTDGFVSIVAKGEYNFHRGDSIKVLDITGVNMKDGKYVSMFCNIKYKTNMKVKETPNRDVIDRDIPDDLI